MVEPGPRVTPTVAAALRRRREQPTVEPEQNGGPPRSSQADDLEHPDHGDAHEDQHEPVVDDLFRVWRPGDLLGADLSFDWLVGGVLVQPTYGMIGGAKKTLKTHVGMFLDVALASGEPFLGRFRVPQPRPVISYVGEGGRVPYTRRLRRVAEAAGITNLGDLPMLTSFDVAPIQSPVFAESLQRDIAAFSQPGLVHVDPYYAFHGNAVNSSNLHEEGTLLAGLSSRCVNAGWTLLITNHFNKTGVGSDLDRITQSGGGEWVDTWLLISHRDTPDVAAGHFQLLLEIGSRQWGGTQWELDMHLGRFDADTGEYDGAITWDVRPRTGPASTPDHKTASIAAHIVDVLEDMPWKLTKSEVSQIVGGNKHQFRTTFDQLADAGRIVHHKLGRTEAGTTKTRPLWGLPTQPVPPELVHVG